MTIRLIESRRVTDMGKETLSVKIAVLGEKIDNITTLLNNHLQSHAKREIAFIAIIGSLTVSLIGLVLKLFIN